MNTFLKDFICLPFVFRKEDLYNRSTFLTTNFVPSFIRRLSQQEVGLMSLKVGYYAKLGIHGLVLQVVFQEKKYHWIFNDQDLETPGQYVQLLATKFNEWLALIQYPKRLVIFEDQIHGYAGFLPEGVLPELVNPKTARNHDFLYPSDIIAPGFYILTDEASKEQFEFAIRSLWELTGYDDPVSYYEDEGEHVVRVGEELLTLPYIAFYNYHVVLEFLNSLLEKRNREERYYSNWLPWCSEFVCFVNSSTYKILLKNKVLKPSRKEEKKIQALPPGKKSLKIIKEYLESMPNDIEAWGTLAERYGELDDWHEVIRITNKKLKDKRNCYALQLIHVRAYTVLEQYDEAFDAAVEALLYFSDIQHHADLWYLMAFCLTELKRFKAADSILERCTRKYSTRVFYWFQYGYNHYRMGNIDKAIQMYKRGVKANNREREGIAICWYNMACMYSLKGEIDESLHALEKSLKLDAAEHFDSAFTDEELTNARNHQQFEPMIRKFQPE